jgi:hypothetical protein
MLLPKFKFVCKCCGVLAAAIFFDVFLGWAAISTLAPRTSGKVGTVLFICITTIGVELCVVLLIIGMLGGKWIGRPAITGFILSGVYYMGWYFPTMTSAKFELLTFLNLIGFPVAVILGGLTYTKFSADG